MQVGKESQGVTVSLGEHGVYSKLKHLDLRLVDISGSCDRFCFNFQHFLDLI